jgi:uncharacterized protein YkwD
MKRNALPFVALLVVVPLGLPGTAGAMSRSERNVVRIVNHVRHQYGLGSLRGSTRLARAADSHSRNMVRRNFFDHTSPDGTSFDRRVRRYTSARSVGETLAAVSRRSRAAALTVQLWMQSPPHRAVLLSRGFHRIGVGRKRGDLGSGARTVFTADFAS